MHTWEDPEINQIQTQNQAKQETGQRKPRKNAPYKWFKLPWGHTVWACPRVYPHVPFFLLINTLLVSLLSISLWKFSSTQLTGQGLVTGHWSSARIQRSHCCSPTSISGQEPKPCFKPLQAEATWDQSIVFNLNIKSLCSHIIICIVWYLLHCLKIVCH